MPERHSRSLGRSPQTAPVCFNSVAAARLPASALSQVFVPPRSVARAHRAAHAAPESPGSADTRHRSIRHWRSPGTLFSFPTARLLRCSFRQCNRFRTLRGRSRALATIETKLEVIAAPMASRKRCFKRHLCRTMTLKCLFFQRRAAYKTLQPNLRRRSQATCLPAAIGRLQFVPDLWSAYGENRDYGQHQDLAASTSIHCRRI